MIKFSAPRIFSLLSGILFLSMIIPHLSVAQSNDVLMGDDNIDADIVDRLRHREAEYAMTTKEGSVDMLVTDDAILIQFSDRFLDDLNDEIHDEGDFEEASVIADALKSMISSGVRSLLDHAVSVPLREIKEVYYSDGTLHVIHYDEGEIFDDLDVDGKKVMEDFSRRDALDFVANVERRLI